MKALTNTFKPLSLVGVLGSAFVLAGLAHDLGFNSPAFMNDQEVEYASRLDVQMASRDVASTGGEQTPQKGYWPVNTMNEAFIEGDWKIRRISYENGKTVFDVQNSGVSSKEFGVSMVATNEIRLNDDKALTYNISKLDRMKKSMVVTREYKGRREVVQMKKIPQIRDNSLREDAAKVVESFESQTNREEKNSPKGVMADGYHDLVVANAIDTKWKRPNFLKGSGEIRGRLTINSGEIQELRLEVLRNTRWKSIFHTYVPIKDGGSFSIEGSRGESTSGILTNSGKGRFKVRFSTGPLAHITATFVTQEEMQKIRQKREEKERKQRRAKREERKQKRDDSHSRDTDNMNKRPNDGFVPKNELTKVEKAKENIKKSGFTFKSGSPSSRKPASVQ